MELPQEFFEPSMEEGGAQDFRSSRKKKLQPPYTLFLDPPLPVHAAICITKRRELQANAILDPQA